MSWTPPERPAWVDRMNAYGDSVDGAEHLVRLDADELLATACSSLGLDDFGGDAWRPHYEACLASLNAECDFHLVGRMMARTEILRALRNRLKLAALWKQRPEILEAPVEAPVFIIGSARTGTSILYELMASDSATRSPAMWEMEHPVEAVRGEEEWAEVSHRAQTFYHVLQPEYETMHANSGYLPNECSFMMMHEFMSTDFGSMCNANGYLAYLSKQDDRQAFRYHRRFLQTLQLREGSRRWLLKGPSHQTKMQELFAVYPDARIIRTHRDPMKSIPSMLNLMGTLQWMRTTGSSADLLAKVLPAGIAASLQQEIDERASGVLPDAQFIDVHFADVVRDPVTTIGNLYERLGWDYPESTREAIASYARNKPRGAHGVHRYSLEATGLDPAEEAARFRFYTEHYGIPTEGA